jgi:hypothetical protein
MARPVGAPHPGHDEAGALTHRTPEKIKIHRIVSVVVAALVGTEIAR